MHKTGHSHNDTVGGHAIDDIKACHALCQECNHICSVALSYCLQKGGKHAEATYIKALLDCVEVCQTSANFMARGSDVHRKICGVCADICEKCAVSCEQVDPNDEMMKHCAEICRRCAASCHKMAA